MTAAATETEAVLVSRFVHEFPGEAAAHVEEWSPERTAEVLGELGPELAVQILERVRPDAAGDALAVYPPSAAALVVARMDPFRAVMVLARLDPEVRESVLDAIPDRDATELRALLAFPADSAGAMMDANVTAFRPGATVAQVQARLRELRGRRVQYVFVVDGDARLAGAVPLQALAVADPAERLERLLAEEPPPVRVQAMSSRTEVVDLLNQHRMTALPVVDVEQRLVGVIRSDALLRAAEAEITTDIQTMVGASREERALSPALFAVRRRLPWLNVNLLTAFLAAAVVGLFEDTIAQFTALAVLLPVVAGQSGNTGAQALAVTMRGLALREARIRHWPRIALKEITVGAVNGVAVATVTGVGVWFWSGSVGLAGVISVSMVLSMTIASLSGASVPMILTLLKQDPAQASSIILTTVTDVMGFLSFLGLATLASSWL